LVAKAVANQSRASFISVKGPELLNKFVGESERAVRLVFQRARASAPCVIFFDELDALCPKRGSGADRSDNVTERVVNQLLTEMDGLEGRKQVFVIAATNRPDIIDPAMLRPGRLDKILYVPLPELESKLSILKTLVRNSPLTEDVDLNVLANHARCQGLSGADLASLVREASVLALEESIPDIYASANTQVDHGSSHEVRVGMKHFLRALDEIQPSVSESQQRRYDQMRQKLCRSRAVMQEGKEEQN
jgi:ribosome biogenesis ATPase